MANTFCVCVFVCKWSVPRQIAYCAATSLCLKTTERPLLCFQWLLGRQDDVACRSRHANRRDKKLHLLCPHRPPQELGKKSPSFRTVQTRACLPVPPLLNGGGRCLNVNTYAWSRHAGIKARPPNPARHKHGSAVKTRSVSSQKETTTTTHTMPVTVPGRAAGISCRLACVPIESSARHWDPVMERRLSKNETEGWRWHASHAWQLNERTREFSRHPGVVGVGENKLAPLHHGFEQGVRRCCHIYFYTAAAFYALGKSR